MIEGPSVFVDIDTQRDFLDPAGALYVPGAQQILANLARLTRFALSHHIPVIATACAHFPDDPELARFPPHCLAGSPGQERVAETACPESVVLDGAHRLVGEIPPHLTLLKRELDVFSRPDAGDLVSRYNAGHPTFVVYGVATDYCVRAAVEGLLERRCRVTIMADAVRGIDPQAEVNTLTELARRGALLSLTEVICGDRRS
jgi:nicotinamidase/pyrazinamidase